MPVSGGTGGGGELGEALAALLVLGYRQEEVMPVLVRLPEDAGAEELIRLTLREMGKKK
jgi:Holliday junction resolvasome RuvABC DNA-binding subunit